MLKPSIITLVLAFWALSTALSQQLPDKVDFRRDVQPILKQFCIECHGPSQQMHGFRLDRRSDAFRGGTNTMIKPGNSAGSRLYLKLISNQFGPQMPLNEPLNQEHIQLIKDWIDQGAQWPDELAAETPLPPSDPSATLIMEVLRKGDKQLFRKLARQAPKVGNLKGPGGATPLMQAALYGDADAVGLLLANGADPNIGNEAGATALMWAVPDLEKTRLLLDKGADVNARSDDGRTPLLIAAGQFGGQAVVRLLLDRGADLAARSPSAIGYATVLSEAARVGDEALLRMLIGRGADVKSAGILALANANRAQCGNCLELLMEGADRRTLTLAASALSPPLGDASALEALLNRGAAPEAREPKGHTLLMLAASSDVAKSSVVQSLLERGAEINTTNSEGRTALDFARRRGANPVVELLVKAGAREGAASTTALPTAKPAISVRAALERSIPLLQRTDVTFLQKSKCVSCHHNNLTAMTVSTARKSGFSIDEQTARRQRKAIGEYLELWRERALQGVGLGGETGAISYVLLGLAAEKYPADAATDAMARFIASQQWPDGRWRVFAHRPPMASSDIAVTAIALRSLQVYGLKAQPGRYQLAVKRATEWLMKAQAETSDERAFQLLGLGWAGVKADNKIIRQRVGELLREQHRDGGWGQLPLLSSDAYATGQVLVALKQTGALAASDAAYRRGIEYLLKTQLEDGSWYVKSRSIPLQPYFESGFPHGADQWISAAATNWAAMALSLR
jgi:ankyrin repeat protein